jgi:hypothetical protein
VLWRRRHPPAEPNKVVDRAEKVIATVEQTAGKVAHAAHLSTQGPPK